MDPKEKEAFFADIEAVDAVQHAIPRRAFKRGRMVAERALKTINGERQDQYGAPEDSFALIAGYWSLYLGAKLDAADVALMMSLFKIGREQKGKGTHADNVVDLVGYSLLYGDMVGYDA